MVPIPIEQEQPLDIDTEFELEQFQDTSAEVADFEGTDFEGADLESQEEVFDQEYDGEDQFFETDEELGRRGRRFPVRPARLPRFLPGRRPSLLHPGPAARIISPSSATEGSEFARWVQDTLNRILGIRLPVTGLIGPETRRAIQSFQTRQGLPVSGIVGPDTQSALLGVTSPGAAAGPGDGAAMDEPASELEFEAEGGTIPVGPFPLAYPPGCPVPDILTITGYPRNRVRIADLPPGEQRLFQQSVRKVVDLVRRSRRRGCKPLNKITVTGRATDDERAATARLRAANAARVLQSRTGIRVIVRRERVAHVTPVGPADPNVRRHSIRISVGHR